MEKRKRGRPKKNKGETDNLSPEFFAETYLPKSGQKIVWVKDFQGNLTGVVKNAV